MLPLVCLVKAQGAANGNWGRKREFCPGHIKCTAYQTSRQGLCVDHWRENSRAHGRDQDWRNKVLKSVGLDKIE